MDFATILGYIKDFVASIPWAKLYESLKTLISGVNWDSIKNLFDGFDLSSGALQTIIDGFIKMITSIIG